MGRSCSSLEGSITVQGHKLSGDDIQLSRKLKDTATHGYSVSPLSQDTDPGAPKTFEHSQLRRLESERGSL